MKKFVHRYYLLLTIFTAFGLYSAAQQNSNVKFVWDEKEPSVNGFARVMQQNKFSFIDAGGRLIHPVNFDAARNFSNHLAAVKKDEKWGFINESGKIVIPFTYTAVYDFADNITAVYLNRKWQLISLTGLLIKNLDIDAFFGFKHGIAKITKNGIWGTMNTKGEVSLTNNTVNAPVLLTPSPKNHTASGVTSVSVCPDNIDFEYGSFLNWQCFIGKVDSVGNTNVITVNPSPPTPNRHTLYNRVLPSPLDPFGLFPINPPDGSNFALKLGNTLIGAQAEKVRYPIHVPVNDSNFSIKYDYAVVFEDPGHTIWTQPRFQVTVIDSATNLPVQCATFEYISTSGLPGFARSTVDTGVIFKPWSTVFLSLRGYAGKTMFLDFTNADCVRRGHWGYSYIDVEKPCGQAAEINYDCDSPHVTTLTAPPGFQTYNWWDSAFANLLGSGQQLVLNPGPTVNSTIWLEMIPYNNFGCQDTLPVKITGVFTANFNISDTSGVCAPHAFTFYNPYLPSTSASWDFGDGSTGSGDTVIHIYNLPGTYLARFNVSLPNGCIGSGYKLVTITQPVGSFSFNGTFYCDSQVVRFDAVTNNADSLFWSFGDGTVLHTKQTTVFHSYTTPGIYIPMLELQSTNGCVSNVPATDTVRIEMLKAGFIHNLVKTCGNTSINISDTSYSYFGILSRQWNFGDGTIVNGGTNLSHSYAVPGNYTITLIITGISGCTDTASIPVNVTINAVPAVTVAGPATVCQGVPFTLTSNVVSADPINYYHWSVSNGFTGTGTSFTSTFNTAGIYNFQLIVSTINGCNDTTTHQLIVNPTPDVNTPPNQVLCSGSSANAVNFSGTVSSTIFNWTNTAPLIGLASGGSGNIPSFTASSNGNSVANAGITVTPTANGCPGPSKTFVITVNPIPSVNQPLNQTLCSGSNANAVNFTSVVNNTNFNWTNTNTQIGLAAGGTGNIPSFIAATNGPVVTTGTISITPSANGCPGLPKSFTITVNPVPDVSQPADQILCNNSNTATVIFAGAVNGTVYNWTNSNTAIGLPASGTGNISSFLININSGVPVIANITVTPSVNGCTGQPKTFTITVNPVPSVVQPANQTLCSNSTTNAISFTGSVNNTLYAWANNNPLIGLVASGAGNIPSFTAMANGPNITSGTITVTPESYGCPGLPKSFTITVNPVPDVNQPADQTLCSGNSTLPVNFTGAVNNTVYNWTNTNNSIGLASNGIGNIAAFTAVNTTSTAASATVSILPMANGCPGTPRMFNITVNPVPAVMQISAQAICNNANTAVIQFSGNVNNALYTWTNTNPSIGLAASGSGDIASFKALNKTQNDITANISVQPVTAACTGQMQSFNIIVHPTPAVVATQNANVCLGKSIQLNASGAAQYVWSPAVNLSCVNCASPVATPADTIHYTVKGTSAAGCQADDSVVLTVIKPFVMAVSPGDTLCTGDYRDIYASNADKYIWSPPAGLNRTDIANPTVRTNTTTTYRVVGYDNHQCFTDTGFVTIVAGPKPYVNIGPDRSLSVGTHLQLNAATSGGPIVSWMWTPAADLSCNNCPSPSTTVKNNSFYSVIVTNTFGCTAVDTIFINSFCKSSQVYIPNAFTPDGDGVNDVLMVRGQGITVKSFRIFNRWGELVFEHENFSPNEIKNGWDGKVRGVPATPDVFVYTAEVFCENNVVYTYKGNITLLK
jgi:gliding motility-associated-like protein